MSERTQALRRFAAGETTQLTLESCFEDDHELGANVQIDGIDMSFPWCGWEVIAALTYWQDSRQAREDLMEFVEKQLQMDDDELDEMISPF